jgi:D-glycero-D-manno-heptose 1,7-bisphosphate phosphatase
MPPSHSRPTSDIIRQACVLVGGKGTRLGTLTRTTPKPLLEIKPGISFLDIVIEQIVRQGFNDIVLLAGHLGNQVRDRYEGYHFGSGHVRVVIEPEPRGTGGALISVQNILASRFLLLNGDSFFDINLRALAAETSDYEALVALRRVCDPSRYGTVELQGKEIVRFQEKSPDVPGPALINAGIYALKRSITHYIRTLPCSIETDIFPTLSEKGQLAGIVQEGYFIDIGLPETLNKGRRKLLDLRARPAVFLDRDGVLNVDHGYIYRTDQINWIAGAQDAVRRMNDLGYRVVVVTNQAGVGHGYYKEDDILALHSWMQDQLALRGAFIDAFYYCMHHPTARIEKYRGHHVNRKPNPGMILQAFSDLNIRRDQSFLIGDKESDIAAAANAGIPGYLFAGGNLNTFLNGLRPPTIGPSRASQCRDKQRQ